MLFTYRIGLTERPQTAGGASEIVAEQRELSG